MTSIITAFMTSAYLPWGWSVSPSWAPTTPVRAVSPIKAATLKSKGESSPTPVPPPVAVTLRRWAETLRFTSTLRSDHFFLISECVRCWDPTALTASQTHSHSLLFCFAFIPVDRVPIAYACAFLPRGAKSRAQTPWSFVFCLCSWCQVIGLRGESQVQRPI